VRWLYHVAYADDPDPLRDADGVLHCSYRDAVAESARLYLRVDREKRVLRIDPRRVVKFEEAATPRGPMPHVLDAVLAADAVRETLPLERVAAGDAPDRVTATRVAFVAFRGMTLLDLVGPYDALSRIATMGFDPTFTCEIVSATTAGEEIGAGEVWSGAGALLRVARERPALEPYDVVVVTGGHGTRELAGDAAVVQWLASFPTTRRMASVCTGALLLGAAGRLTGKRATTHASALGELARYGATSVADERVVVDGAVITAGGVTAGIELGLWLVEWLEGAETRAKITQQMEWRS